MYMSTEKISSGLARWRHAKRVRESCEDNFKLDPSLCGVLLYLLASKKRREGRENEQFDLSAEQTFVTTPEVEQSSVLPTENAKESKPKSTRNNSVKNTGNSSANTGAVI